MLKYFKLNIIIRKYFSYPLYNWLYDIIIEVHITYETNITHYGGLYKENITCGKKNSLEIHGKKT